MESYGIIDMHCDTLTALIDQGADMTDGGHHLSLDKMEAGQYMMQCMAVFLRLDKGDVYRRCVGYIDGFDRMMARHHDRIGQVRSAADLQALRAQGRLGAMLTIEEGGALEGRLDNLRYFYDRGVRMMTLTWNFENEIGYPNNMHQPPFTVDTVHGLKPFGLQVVRKMNELGMIVDVSHLDDAGFYDVIATSSKPVVASHSDSRAICDVPRNMTDDMIKRLAANGGVMGLNYCADFVNADGSKSVIPGLAAHARHIAEVGGIDVLALGSDFDGIGDLDDLTGGDRVPALMQALTQAGFTAADLRKICHDNFLRVLAAQ